MRTFYLVLILLFPMLSPQHCGADEFEFRLGGSAGDIGI